MSIVEIATTIIIPTLQNIGKEWVGGNIEIHDEHRMSFHVREHLLALNQIIPEPKKAKNVVLACIAGDWHEIPLQISALILKSEGWKPIVLGVNTPEEEILSAAKQWNAKIITVIKIYTKNKRKEYLESLENLPMTITFSWRMAETDGARSGISSRTKKIANTSNTSVIFPYLQRRLCLGKEVSLRLRNNIALSQQRSL